MRMLKRVVAGLAAGVMFAGIAWAGGVSPDEAAKKLSEGNKNFVSGKLTARDLGARRMELTKGQAPFAIVVTCSDSRVAPEYIFDQGLGDIFVIRVAGNVMDPISIGSIEYAAEHLHSPLLIVMGHSGCGAVKAALESEGEVEGNIGAILKKIKPAVATAKAAGKKDDAETLDLAVQENVKNVQADIMANSTIISHLVHEGKLKVMLGEYHLDSGSVEIIEGAKAEGGHGGAKEEEVPAGAEGHGAHH